MGINEKRDNYVVLDLEMTGLNPKRDAILEVGAARIRDGKVEETISFFVNPGRMLTEEITELTGITQEMAETGITPAAALRRVMEFVQDDIWVGHNIIFDYSFLKQLAVNARVSFEKSAVDTLKLARKLMEEPKSKSLESLCDYLGLDRENKHRALDDAIAAMQLYEWMRKNYEAGNPACFAPKELLYRPKRETPATKMQKIHLKELADYHRIELDVSWETITRSEASRLTDRLILRYGRIKDLSD